MNQDSVLKTSKQRNPQNLGKVVLAGFKFPGMFSRSFAFQKLKFAMETYNSQIINTKNKNMKNLVSSLIL